MYRKYFKRILDIVLSLAVFPLFIVIYLIFALLIKLEDGGTVFYKAKRRGLHGDTFDIIKFRSMKMNAPDWRNDDNSTYNSPDDTRLTKIGKILRKTSLDETAQLLNVIKGDMSLVGPRPITIDKPLEEYDEKRRIRLTVRPGITGYQQAYFRNSIKQEHKFELDANYVQNLNFGLDLKILCKTLQTVVVGKNIYEE